MRIRQIRPEFFTDATMARLPAEVRLTYIGLWIVADDAGFLKLDIQSIGAVLFPYEAVKRREAHLQSACDLLSAAGRLITYECGCALIPTLSRHQRVTGRTSTTAKEEHGKHLALTGKQSPLTDKHLVAPVMVGNGRERYGTVVAPAGASGASTDEPSEFSRQVARPS